MKDPEEPVGSERAVAFYVFGPFRLDPARHRLSRDGRPVPLTPKPLETLLVLVRHRDRVVGKEELLRAVWPDVTVAENSLAQSVTTLRRALGERPKEHRYIATMSGRGYRFVAPVREMSNAARAPSPVAPAARRTLTVVLALVGLAVHLCLPVTEENRHSRARSTNESARQAYLKGRFFWNKRTEAGLARAIEHFDQAARFDPQYGLAYSGLADSYALLWEYRHGVSREAADRSVAAAERALELDGQVAETRTSMGNVKMVFRWDFTGAEREFRRAIELDPGYATAHHWYAWCLMAVGRLEEATAELRRAQELDPLSPIITSAQGTSRYFAGDYDGAIELYRRALELEPNFVRARLSLGQVYATKRLYSEAITELQAARVLSADSSESLGALGHVYGRAGLRSRWKEQIDELRRRSERGRASAYDLAIAYAGDHDESHSLQWLEQACDQRIVWPALLRFDPRLENLRSEALFKRSCAV